MNSVILFLLGNGTQPACARLLGPYDVKQRRRQVTPFASCYQGTATNRIT